MITPTKLAVVFLTSVGIAGGSAGTIYALWPETISVEKKLIKENKKILDSNSSTLWEIKLATYNRIKSTNEEIKLTENTWGNLKSWCTQQTKAPFDERKQKLYEGIKEVCTVPSNKEKLLSLNKALASTPEDWEGRKTAYKHTNNTTPIPTIDKSKLENKDDITNWCKETLEEEYQEKQENNYFLVLKWCTKTGE